MLESSSHITKNLRRVYLSATPEQKQAGLMWYVDAHRIAKGFGTEFGQLTWEICRIIAALSPQCSWERNLHRVREYLTTGHSPGLPPAWKGMKVISFRASIFLKGETFHVCVDRHMIAASLPLTASIDGELLKTVFKSPPRIRRIQKAVRLIAREYGIWPAQAQAVIWVVQRGKGENQTTDRSSLQQVRTPVRGVGIRKDGGGSQGRSSSRGLVEQRLDDRPLPRRRRSQRVEPDPQKDQKGEEKKKHPRQSKRSGGQARKRGSRSR